MAEDTFTHSDVEREEMNRINKTLGITYELNRTDPRRNPGARGHGWALVDAFRKHGLNPRDPRNNNLITRLLGADLRPHITPAHNSPDYNPYQTPTSRELARAKHNIKHYNASNQLGPYDPLPGETRYIMKGNGDQFKRLAWQYMPTSLYERLGMSPYTAPYMDNLHISRYSPDPIDPSIPLTAKQKSYMDLVGKHAMYGGVVRGVADFGLGTAVGTGAFKVLGHGAKLLKGSRNAIRAITSGKRPNVNFFNKVTQPARVREWLNKRQQVPFISRLAHPLAKGNRLTTAIVAPWAVAAPLHIASEGIKDSITMNYRMYNPQFTNIGAGLDPWEAEKMQNDYAAKYQNIMSSTSSGQDRANAIAELNKVYGIDPQELLTKSLYELPIIGYTKGPDGRSRPVRKRYLDHYDFIRANYGKEEADAFRTYHITNGVLRSIDNAENLTRQYEQDKQDYLQRRQGIINKGLHPVYRDRELRKLNAEFMPKLRRRDNAVTSRDAAIGVFKDFSKYMNDKYGIDLAQ